MQNGPDDMGAVPDKYPDKYMDEVVRLTEEKHRYLSQIPSQKQRLVDQLNKWSREATYKLAADPPYLIEVSRFGEDRGLINLRTAAYRLLCLVGTRNGEFLSGDIADALSAVAYYMREMLTPNGRIE